MLKKILVSNQIHRDSRRKQENRIEDKDQSGILSQSDFVK